MSYATLQTATNIGIPSYASINVPDPVEDEGVELFAIERDLTESIEIMAGLWGWSLEDTEDYYFGHHYLPRRAIFISNEEADIIEEAIREDFMDHYMANFMSSLGELDFNQ